MRENTKESMQQNMQDYQVNFEGETDRGVNKEINPFRRRVYHTKGRVTNRKTERRRVLESTAVEVVEPNEILEWGKKNGIPINGTFRLTRRRMQRSFKLSEVPPELRSQFIQVNYLGPEPMLIPRYGDAGMYGHVELLLPNIPKEEIQMRMRRLLRWYESPRPADEQELAERIREFFTECAVLGDYPSYEKLCMALGATVEEFKAWVYGRGVTDAWSAICSRGISTLSGIMGEMAANGEIDKNVYMFQARKYFNMQDNVTLNLNVTTELGNIKETESELLARLDAEIINLEQNADGSYEKERRNYGNTHKK